MPVLHVSSSYERQGAERSSTIDSPSVQRKRCADIQQENQSAAPASHYTFNITGDNTRIQIGTENTVQGGNGTSRIEEMCDRLKRLVEEAAEDRMMAAEARRVAEKYRKQAKKDRRQAADDRKIAGKLRKALEEQLKAKKEFMRAAVYSRQLDEELEDLEEGYRRQMEQLEKDEEEDTSEEEDDDLDEVRSEYSTVEMRDDDMEDSDDSERCGCGLYH